MSAEILRAAGAYVGAPYREHGRDPAGWDCWGLVRYLRRELFGLDSPCWGDVYARGESCDAARVEALIRARLDAWAECAPGPGAVALIGRGGVEGHVGLMLTPVDVIHVEIGSRTVIVRRDAPALRFRSFRFFEARR